MVFMRFNSVSLFRFRRKIAMPDDCMFQSGVFCATRQTLTERCKTQFCFLNLAQQSFCDIFDTGFRAHHRPDMTGPMDTLSFARPALGPDATARAAADFARTGHVRAPGVLPMAEAEALHGWLTGDAPFVRVLNQADKVWDLDAQALASLGTERSAALTQAVHAQARDGFQYIYDALRVSDDPATRTARALPVDRLVAAFNTQPWLDLFRTLTGEPAIRMVDGQATRYLPGHFLTGHDDDVAGKDRVAAYVLNLTPHWRTEWGGLLLFHDAPITGACPARTT
jgi:hypothetical protein